MKKNEFILIQEQFEKRKNEKTQEKRKNEKTQEKRKKRKILISFVRDVFPLRFLQQLQRIF
jgi:hypothetical protein